MVFDEAVDSVLKNICMDIEKRYQMKFLEIGTDKDYVHFLVQSVPKAVSLVFEPFWRLTMKSALAIILAALLLLTGCASTQNRTPEELEAIRKSNERYERSKGP